MKKQLLISLGILLFLLLATTAVVLYAKGYHFGLAKGNLQVAETGLLVTTSKPDGASVFVNGHLTTATDNTINLFPGEYDIKIEKEGYFTWHKKIKIQAQIVAKAEALLFPIAPKLESITASGVENPTIDPSLSRIAYTVASQSARKNGIYILDMTSRPILTLRSAATQIVDDTIDIFSKARLAWSPDGQELVATISATSQATTYLLKTNQFNQNPSDITATLTTTQTSWENDRLEKNQARIDMLKLNLKDFIAKNFKISSWSPDETKILYQASSSAFLPIVINPRLIGTNSTPEERNLKEGNIYVYDIKEDRNYNIPTGNSQNSKSLIWFPDSKHLIFTHDKKIEIMECDGTNSTTIYAGPFIDNYVFPWTNESKVLILTNLGNPDILPNLYTIGLK